MFFTNVKKICFDNLNSIKISFSGFDPMMLLNVRVVVAGLDGCVEQWTCVYLSG
jgi:hypothetical protein